MGIADRIKEERERLGLSQAAFGQIGGVAKNTVFAWENGSTAPNAVFLEAASNAGADVLYIVTGRREKAAGPPAPNKYDEWLKHDPSVPLTDPVNPEMMERVFDMLEGQALRRGRVLKEREKLHMAADLYNYIYSTINRDSGSK